MDSSDGGRKWALAKGVFWSANVLAGAASVVSIVKGGNFMDVLQWWSMTQGGVLALYSGANVLQKGVTK